MEATSTCDKVIKYNSDRSLVLVEYPGVVQNVDKMIETLGGMKNIQDTYKIPDKRIDLRFRPTDPCCHPVCGDRTPTTSLLLRVRKYRRKKKDKSAPDEFRYIPEIVGVIENQYKFNVLCDFQYLPLCNDTESDKLVNMIPNLKMNDLNGEIYTRETPLFLPPPTFSRFDHPQDVLFRKPTEYRVGRQVEPNPNQISIARPKRSHYAQYIKFEEKWTPQKPLLSATEMIKRQQNYEGLLAETKKLFEDRPIWSKNALVFLLKTTHERLKNILPVVAYYFITGPWRSLWVKLGYDPRVHQEAARYQLLNFRVRKGLNNHDIPIKVKRSTLNYRLPNLKPRSKGAKNVVSSLQEQKWPPPDDGTPRYHTEAVYRYTPGVLPVYRQMFYQHCDIKLPEVEDILKQHFDQPAPASCDLKSGWLQEKTASKIRDLLTKDIYETISSQKHVRVRDMKRSRSKWSKKVAKVHLTAEDRKDAPESELVDNFHSWGMPSGSSSEDEIEDMTGDVVFEYPEEELDEEEISAEVIMDSSVNAGEMSIAAGGLEDVDDADDFMEGFDAFSSEIDDPNEGNTATDID